MKLLSCSRLFVAGLVFSGAAYAQDECASAANLPFDTATPFDTTTATPSAPDFSCAPFGGDPMSQDIWFEFTAPVDYDAVITTCNTADYDTKIEIYEGSCGALTSVGCFEDTTGCAGFTTTAEFAAVGGTQYFVRVGGWRLTEFGTGTILSIGPPPPPYECADAAPIAVDMPTAFDTTAASASTEPWGCTPNFMGDVWYTFVASADYMATASTCGTASYDTRIEVYSGACGALVSEGCNDDGPGCSGFTSQVDFNAVSGTQYWVRVGGFNASAVGTGDLVVTGPPPAIPNDECSGALPLANGVGEAFDTTMATFSASAPTSTCGGTTADPIDIWYSFTALDSGPAQVTTCDSADYDTRIEIYSGDCGALVSEVCNDDGPGCTGFTSQADFTATAGTTYYVRLAGFNDATGTGTVTATYPDTVGNDDCSGAVPVDAGVFSISNLGATDSGQSMSCGLNGSATDIWFVYSASEDCPVTVDLSGTDAANGNDWDTTMTIWSGDCMSLVEIECDDDGGTGFDSFITFDAVAGTDYYIQIGSFNGQSGSNGIMAITEGLGSIVCVGNANSTGFGATLKASGSTAVADNDLTLNVAGLPLNENVLFVNSRETIFVANPGGSMGDLCIGSFALGRHLGAIMNSGASGTVSLDLNLANIPTNLGLTAIVAGETWYWQAWYRDLDGGGMPTSNLSAAICVTFN